MKLTQRISLKERQAEQARLALAESVVEFRYLLKAKLASRTAMVLGFAGGWLIGWRRPRRSKPVKKAEAKPAAGLRQRQGLPDKWIRSYFVWPFLLATARDALVSRRPSRREA